MNITVTTVEPRLITVFGGARGPQGVDGPVGPDGPPGAGINVLGAWVDGTTYFPNDAVTDRSSAANGVQSLFVQRSNVPGGVSATRPYLDPLRWEEIGATDISNITGAIWTIRQISHMFTEIGTPVGFSFQSSTWVKADNRMSDETAIAVVREIIDVDTAVLQTTGAVPDIDPAVIFPSGSTWQPGRLYYTSPVRGRLQLDPTISDPTAEVHPVMIPTKLHLGVDDNTRDVGVVLPWRPAPIVGAAELVAFTKFYFDATAGQTVISGIDLAGNTLTYTPGDNTSVFVNGANLSDFDQYVAVDGTTVTLTAPLSANDRVEVWVPAAVATTPSSAVKADSLEAMFDGVTLTFPLTHGGGTDVLIATPGVTVYIDANPQEPFVDYAVAVNPGDPNASEITFTEAPEQGDRFWAVIGLTN